MKLFNKLLTVSIIVIELFSLGTAEASVEINETNFPDENFRNYVSKNFDKDSDGTLSDEEISKVIGIYVKSLKIQSLKGIEFFIALMYLECEFNQLTALDVSKNTALTRLVCTYNELTVLDVSNNTALTELYCDSNKLTALNVSNNTRLTNLSCIGNQLTALNVSGCSALTVLYCSGNELTVLDVSNNTRLAALYCYNNQLTALDVSNNTRLSMLYCSGNQLTTLDISKNTNLIYLYCVGNQLTALDLSKNTKLTYLKCDNQTPKGLKYSQTPPSKSYDMCLKDYIDVSKIKSGSVKCYKKNYEKISSTYDDSTGCVTTSSIPDYVYYEYNTGYNDRYMDVEFYVEVPEELKLNVDFPSTGTIKASYSGSATVTGGTNPYTWTYSGVPDWLTIETSEATLTASGIPTKAGTYSFKLIVTDSAEQTEEIAVEITVTAPKISGSLTKTGKVKKQYTSSVNVSGGTAPYKWSVSSGTLPAGLKLKYDKSTGKATLTGKPSEAGQYTFKLKVADTNKASATKKYTVTITEPVITGTFNAGVVKKSYTGTASVTGGVTPYVWTINTIPDGLKFSQNAKGTKAYLKGKPTKAGTYKVTLKVVDANKAKTSKKFTFKIAKKSTSTSNSLMKNEKGFEGVLNVETMTGEFTPLTELSIFEEDILSKGEGKDEDLVTVKADKPLRFIIGEWPVEVSVNEIKVLIDDEVNEEIEISDENTFTIPKEFVKGDFKVKVEAGEFESNEIFISAID